MMKAGRHCWHWLRSRSALLAAWFLTLPLHRLAAEPQDPPDFRGVHKIPPSGVEAAPPRSWEMGIFDIGMLVLALSLATWMIHKTRSRRGLFWLSVASLGYFGFVRQGCVCAIGSIQDVTIGYALGNGVPLVIAAYFFVPLLFSALFGRSYCAAVCPQGAIQDLVIVKPIEVPRWLEHVLGLLPFIYLGLSVLLAATLSAKIICDYDPFISFFRLDGHPAQHALGAVFLGMGMFIGRPYCRYMCPYGVLLRIFSYVSKWNVKIYPDRCIDCTLCDDSCPFGAIDKTTPQNQGLHPKEGKARLVAALVALPVLIGGLGWLSAQMTKPLAMSHEKVRVAFQMEEELLVANLLTKNSDSMDEWAVSPEFQQWRDKGMVTGDAEQGAKRVISESTETLYDDGVPPEEVFADAQKVLNQFHTGLWWFGAFIGLVVGIKLVSLCIRRKRLEYEANRGSCYSCGRCYDYCPGSNGIPVQFETGGHIRPQA